MMLVCGESLIDVFATQETRTGFAMEAKVGGSPLNVAIGLARLGQSVAFFGAVSTDFMGQRLMRALETEGVDLTGVARCKAPTTLAVVGLDEQGVPSYAFHGTGGADRQLGAADLAQLPDRWTVLSLGSFATVVEPVAGTLRRLVKRQRKDVLVAFDPNVRLSVDPREDVWRAQLDWMLSQCHVLKISAEDLQLLHAGTTAEDFAAAALLRGVQLVVVTHGARGAEAWAAGGAFATVSAPSIDVVDTGGAGDTFQAALLHGLSQRGWLHVDRAGTIDADALRGLLDFGVRAAALTCSRRGADMPTIAELA